MTNLRAMAITLIATMATGSVLAQFDGPAPLAWRWTQSSNASPSGSPLVDGNTIFVAVGQRMFALDLETGNQKWKFPQLDPIDGYFRTAPIKMGNLIVAASDNKMIFAVDMTTGEKKWQHLAEGAISGGISPVGDKMIAYAMSDGSVNTINAANGNNAMAKPVTVEGGLGGRISVYLNTILVPTGENNLVQLDASTGRIIKTRQFTNFSGDTKPVVYGDTIYLNSNNYVIALSGADLRMKWQSDCEDFITFPVAAGPNGIAAGTRDGKAFILDPRNGRKSFVNDLTSQPAASPSAVGNNFVFPTTNGVMTLVDGKTGLISWVYQIRPNVKFAEKEAAPSGGGSRMGGTSSLGGQGAGTQGSGSGEKVRVISIPAAGPPVLAGTTLLVLTKDSSLLAFDRNSGVDLTSPEVGQLFPKAGEWVSTQRGLEVYFTIDDEASGLQTGSVEVTVDGEKKDFTLGRDGVLSVRFGPSNKNSILGDGHREIVIRCKDWMGNETVKTFSLLIDNKLPPIQAPKSVTDPAGRGGAGGGNGNGAGR